MAIIGTAHLHVVPTFDGLSAAVSNAFGSVDAGGAGKAMGTQAGSQFSAGLSAVQGAIVGVFSQITQSAMGAVTSHIDSAVSRVDILHNYPLVMESLGVSADEASNSIQTMSDRLQNLPTRLDDMASTVQGLYAASQRYGVSLEEATDAGLALNNMLMAGGGSTQVVNSAMEQFRQILSKGKPDMQDWKSLLSAAPGQMNQLAQAMLGAEASTQDLYYALGGGKDSDEHMDGLEFASISVNELLEAIIALNSEGSDEFSSFQQQAEEASGGIGTAAANMGNAITRGLADVMDAIGRENIVGVIDDIKKGIREAFGAISDLASKAVPYLKDAWGWIKENGVEAAGLAVSVGTAVTAGSKASGIITAFGEASEKAGGPLKLLAGAIDPVAIGIAALTLVVETCVGAYIKAQEHQERLTKATIGLTDAVSRATALDEYTQTIDGLGVSAAYAREDVQKLIESIGDHADAISGIIDSAEGEIATLNTAQQYIDEYAGKTDLSSTEMGKLKWAIEEVNDQLGTNYTLEEALNGEYEDEEGNIINVREALDDLIASREAEIRMAALQDSITEAMKAREEASKALAIAEAEYAEARERVAEAHPDWTDEMVDNTMLAGQYVELTNNLNDAQAAYDSTSQAVEDLSEELGIATAVATGTATDWEEWANGLSDLFKDRLEVQSGKSISELIHDLENAGYSVEDFKWLTEDQLADLAKAYDTNGELITSEVDAVIEKGREFTNTPMKNHLEIETYEAENAIEGLIRNYSGRNINLTASVHTTGGGRYTVNAAGGYRLHADGAIATKAMPLDIVGEDGAEAIVPLTNRRYAQPFIDMLAEGITKLDGGTTVNVNLNYRAGDDANRMARDLARAISRTTLARG